MRQGDRPAHNSAGQDENEKIQFAANSAQKPRIDEEAAALMQARRFAMLQSFMRQSRLLLKRFPRFWGRSERGKGKGKATGKSGGAAALQARQTQKRAAKKAAFLGRGVLAFRRRDHILPPRPPHPR